MEYKLKIAVQEYKVYQQLLGEGHCGRVYVAYNSNTNQKLAAKIMKNNQESNKQINFLKSNFQTLKKLQSSNIAKYHDIKNIDGQEYIFLEYCERNLNKQIKKKVKQKDFMSQEEIINIFTQICNGYKELHQFGIVHRDIKPENILINKGVYKISDFGFAKFLNNQNNKTQNTLLGTRLYMAPQILKDNNKYYDSRCDVWSLGIILYRLLYFKNPFGKELQSCINKIHRQNKIYIPQTIQRSQKLRILIFQMLQFQPQKRIKWSQLFGLKFLSPPEQLNQQQIIKVQKILKYQRQLSKFVKKVFQCFCYFQSQLSEEVYRFGSLAFVYNIINMNKTILNFNLLQNFNNQEQISKQAWLKFKKTNNYWQFYKDFDNITLRFQNFIQAFTPKINRSLQDSNNQSLKKAVEKTLNIKQNNCMLQMKQIIEWVLNQIDNKLPEFIINYIKIAKQPQKYYNDQTDFEKIFKNIDQQFKSI